MQCSTDETVGHLQLSLNMTVITLKVAVSYIPFTILLPAPLLRPAYSPAFCVRISHLFCEIFDTVNGVISSQSQLIMTILWLKVTEMFPNGCFHHFIISYINKYISISVHTSHSTAIPSCLITVINIIVRCTPWVWHASSLPVFVCYL